MADEVKTKYSRTKVKHLVASRVVGPDDDISYATITVLCRNRNSIVDIFKSDTCKTVKVYEIRDETDEEFLKRIIQEQKEKKDGKEDGGEGDIHLDKEGSQL